MIRGSIERYKGSLGWEEVVLILPIEKKQRRAQSPFEKKKKRGNRGGPVSEKKKKKKKIRKVANVFYGGLIS